MRFKDNTRPSLCHLLPALIIFLFPLESSVIIYKQNSSNINSLISGYDIVTVIDLLYINNIVVPQSTTEHFRRSFAPGSRIFQRSCASCFQYILFVRLILYGLCCFTCELFGDKCVFPGGHP